MFIRKGIIAAISLCLLVAFCSCSNTEAQAAMEYPLRIFKENRNGKVTTYSLEDDNTGAYYIVVVAESSKGDLNRSVAICPRYNADGTLYTGPYFNSKSSY